MEYLTLCQNSTKVPAKAIQPQFNYLISIREFYNMFTSTGRHLKYLPLRIDREEFQAGNTLLVFNLNTVKKSKVLSSISSGNLRLKNEIQILLIPNHHPHRYNSILEINSTRQVVLNCYYAPLLPLWIPSKYYSLPQKHFMISSAPH